MVISAAFLLLDCSQGVATALFWASVPEGPQLRAGPRDAHLKRVHIEGDSSCAHESRAPLTLTVMLSSWLLVF